MTMLTILEGDCVEKMRGLADGSVQCCITSPPYYGLRNYGHDGQIGQEDTPQAYVERLVGVFREVRRVLKDDGVLWLNLGDSYNARPGQRKTTDKAGAKQQTNRGSPGAPSRSVVGLKPKDLIGIPWMVAFALRSDGWYLRSACPWVKRNCMPESVKDRPTAACEMIFLLSKSEEYHYDRDAVLMPLAGASVERLAQDVANQTGTARANGGAKTNGNLRAVCSGKNSAMDDHHSGKRITDGVKQARAAGGDHDNPFGPKRNLRNSDFFFESWQGLLTDEDGEPLVFLVNPQPYREAHFATWPERLVRPMVLAGCPAGGTVLDPFGGSGTTGKVALELGRAAILCELNPQYCQLMRQRCETTVGLGL